MGSGNSVTRSTELKGRELAHYRLCGRSCIFHTLFPLTQPFLSVPLFGTSETKYGLSYGSFNTWNGISHLLTVPNVEIHCQGITSTPRSSAREHILQLLLAQCEWWGSPMNKEAPEGVCAKRGRSRKRGQGQFWELFWMSRIYIIANTKYVKAYGCSVKVVKRKDYRFWWIRHTKIIIRLC